MQELFINRLSKRVQYLFSFLTISTVGIVCSVFLPLLDYRVVAFVLLLAVSVLAVLFDILPVLFAAVLSALVWDFFFIPPRYTFTVGSGEDTILLLMYFVIALVNAVLTYKIRQIESMARKEAEKLNAVKLYNTMLNSLSHELRTPITTIIGATDNLQSSESRLGPVERAELVVEISKAALRLNQQVENLLNMSRLESGFLKPKNDWCDINELIYDVVGQVEERGISQKINISVSPSTPLFRIDKGMLEHVLYNLLSNAVIYSGKESQIRISANAYADVLHIEVADNGPGFPEDEIPFVFDKFYRLRHSKSGGTGLGLSIVKGFVEAMGGHVELKNLAEGGACFMIDLEGATSYLKNLKNE